MEGFTRLMPAIMLAITDWADRPTRMVETPPTVRSGATLMPSTCRQLSPPAITISHEVSPFSGSRTRSRAFYCARYPFRPSHCCRLVQQAFPAMWLVSGITWQAFQTSGEKVHAAPITSLGRISLTSHGAGGTLQEYVPGKCF